MRCGADQRWQSAKGHPAWWQQDADLSYCDMLQGGRVCVAVPASNGDAPKGILLGGSAGVLYIEPPAAVGPNNDLAAARGEVNVVRFSDLKTQLAAMQAL